jgi:hypothetical protein
MMIPSTLEAANASNCPDDGQLQPPRTPTRPSSANSRQPPAIEDDRAEMADGGLRDQVTEGDAERGSNGSQIVQHGDSRMS